jgi:hypothetical protein
VSGKIRQRGVRRNPGTSPVVVQSVLASHGIKCKILTRYRIIVYKALAGISN